MNLDGPWFIFAVQADIRARGRNNKPPPSLSVPGATSGMHMPAEIYYLCIKRNIIIPHAVTSTIRTALHRALSYPPGN